MEYFLMQKKRINNEYCFKHVEIVAMETCGLFGNKKKKQENRVLLRSVNSWFIFNCQI